MRTFNYNGNFLDGLSKLGLKIELEVGETVEIKDSTKKTFLLHLKGDGGPGGPLKQKYPYKGDSSKKNG